MKRVLQARSHRAFSQQALRRRDDPQTSGRSVSGSSHSPKTHAPPRLELDGRSYLLPTLTLSRTVARKLGEAHVNFQTRARKTPIVLDLQQVSSDGSPHAQPIKKHELRAEIEALQNVGFVPVGITNASEDIKQLAAAMNLPYFISTRLRVPQEQYSEITEPQQQQPYDKAPTAVAKEEESEVSDTIESSASTPDQNAQQDSPHVDVTPPAVSEKSGLPPMVVTASVRSGQQIFAQNRSLVILGNVNSGAEVLADEDVFVMGALKGRALAGIGGNVSARIICQSFDAELISIAHHFTTCDELDEQKHAALRMHKPTVVSLQDDFLHFQSTH
uniref:Septum formation inhibitor MinC C-terminal domain-containing protein n=1 Tax=Globisporangium ultimum (strain ATCC 200006 / CBS 805.95 / DAOM BR144) TaxID=431595 RepID=K3XBV6_GLOUD